MPSLGGGVIEVRGDTWKVGAQRLSGCGGDCSPRFTAQGDESDGDATFCSAQKRAQRSQ